MVTVVWLWRYPVRSMMGEELNAAEVTDHGLVGGGAPPPGATAICRDGDYSFSTHHTGTCSGHGGVRQWLTN